MCDPAFGTHPVGLEAAVRREIKGALVRRGVPNEPTLARLRAFTTTLLADGT
ncbi:hypothetical protein [Streptomyces beihaiensis]|uniref:Uncharacterized protein n=1 Tax=Streptomyces beihaiensis TaxID=2984495 RepID=A0ABT3TXG4_9ACTN|nr:hypothetical protein [Streptomyces beihaiensis]MCX3061731.1 hypothetical protein [Streptomyces beihaiensis]